MHLDDLHTRRSVLRTASLAALAAFVPLPLSAFDPQAVTTAGRVLVFVELDGGNDGLNTIVPYLDPTYLTKRGALALTVAGADYTRQVIPFDTFSGSTALPKPAGMGVHRSLEHLQPAWRAGHMAVVHGLGYANPNRSHFRGMDIWNTGATDDQPLVQTGWLGRMIAAEGVPSDTLAQAVVFRRASSTPSKHPSLTTLSMDRPSEFVDRAGRLTDPSDGQIAAAPSALAHVLDTHRRARRARDSLATAIAGAPAFATAFPTTSIGNQAKYVAQCIAGGLPTPFYKIAISGFDNHTNQAAKHADLLSELGQALASLRSALIEAGRWNDVLVMTYSEFGRRIEANGSAGTDHGTAAPHIALGGRVAGGILGSQPSLTDTDSRGDLKHQLDLRRWFTSGAEWIGISAGNRGTGLDPFTAGLTFSPLALTA